MSKALLTIGYSSYLLPSTKGLATILAALEGAIEVRDRLYQGKLELCEKQSGVQVQIVPDSTRICRPETEANGEGSEVGTVATYGKRCKAHSLPGRRTQLLLER